MKNYLDQLAIELYLRVEVNGQPRYTGLHDHHEFDAASTVIVDDIEILPKYGYLAVDNKLKISEPFYCWLHRVTDQGWLLEPQ